ncbi:MAG: cyanophycin synthetase, partial [Planctomycetota bacterium]
RLAEGRTVVTAEIGGRELMFKIESAGRHFAMNALGALALLDALGADVGQAVLGLGQWRPGGGRGRIERLLLDPMHPNLTLDLLDDSYNANPASVGAALDTLAATAPGRDTTAAPKGRRIAILGDMLELGPSELALHAEVADHPALQSVSLVHCVGPLSRALWDKLPQAKRGELAETAADLAALMPRLLEPGDVVLVKGSLGIGLRVVVDAIRKLGHPPPEQ